MITEAEAGAGQLLQPQRLEEARNGSFPEPSKETQPCRHADFRLWFQNCETLDFCCFKPVCSK